MPRLASAGLLLLATGLFLMAYLIPAQTFVGTETLVPNTQVGPLSIPGFASRAFILTLPADAADLTLQAALGDPAAAVSVILTDTSDPALPTCTLKLWPPLTLLEWTWSADRLDTQLGCVRFPLTAATVAKTVWSVTLTAVTNATTAVALEVRVPAAQAMTIPSAESATSGTCQRHWPGLVQWGGLLGALSWL